MGKRKSLKCLIFRDLPNLKSFKSGATSNRKRVCIALFLNKLYLFYDVNPLNKVFTALLYLTQVCILSTISESKDRDLFHISIVFQEISSCFGCASKFYHIFFIQGFEITHCCSPAL